jgi:phosphatidylglycerophosphate synthase
MTSVQDQPVRSATVAAGRGARQPRPWARTLTIAALAQGAALVVLSMTGGLGPAGWLAAIAYTAAICLGLAGGLRRAGRNRFGPADKVTLARSTLVGCVAALVADTADQAAPVVPVIAMTLVALLLDGVDGQVARRTGTASELGARFDMEVDAFLILVLSGYVAVQIGPWVLAIGLMRYAFIAAGQALAWLRVSVPSSMAGKVVAVVQGVVLLVATAGVLPLPVTSAAVAVALAALVWSFGRSVLWLYRQRVSAPGRSAANRTRSGSGHGRRPSAIPALAERA